MRRIFKLHGILSWRNSWGNRNDLCGFPASWICLQKSGNFANIAFALCVSRDVESSTGVLKKVKTAS